MRTCEWVSAPLPSHHAWLPASQIAAVCHQSRCIDFPALLSSGTPAHTSPNWVRHFLCTSRLSHAAASHTWSSPSALWGTGLGGGADEVGLSFHHNWSPASLSFLTGLTAMAEVRVKPRLLPRLPRLSTLGSEWCHQAPHLSFRSPLCSEIGGRANKRQMSLLVFIICIIIAPQCLVVDQNHILLALCKPRANAL